MFVSEDVVQHLVEKYGAGLVAVMTGLESIGIPLPAETALLSASVYAGTTHRISIYTIVGAAIAGAIIGDNVGYMIGRYVGYPLLNRYGHHVGLTTDRLTLGRYLFQKHGTKVVFFGRFIALLRTLAAMLAGANQMPWGRFLLANAGGGIAWACVYGFGAYALGNKIKDVAGPASLILPVIAVVAVIGGMVVLHKKEAAMIQTAKQSVGNAPR